MKPIHAVRFGSWTFAVVLITLSVASSARALFPPPFYYTPTVTSQGTTDPPCPPLPPDPFQDPPAPEIPPMPTCGGGHVASTPEPTSLIMGAIGLSIAGAYALRRRFAK